MNATFPVKSQADFVGSPAASKSGDGPTVYDGSDWVRDADLPTAIVSFRFVSFHLFLTRRGDISFSELVWIENNLSIDSN